MDSILSARAPECITCNPVTSDVWDWWCWAFVKIKIFFDKWCQALFIACPRIVLSLLLSLDKHSLFSVLVLLFLWCLSFLLELMDECPYLHLPSPPWIKSVSLYFTCFPASNAVKWKIAKAKAIIPQIPNFLLPPAASAPPDSLLVGQGEKQERSWHCINNKPLMCYQGYSKHKFKTAPSKLRQKTPTTKPKSPSQPKPVHRLQKYCFHLRVWCRIRLALFLVFFSFYYQFPSISSLKVKGPFLVTVRS